MNPLPTAYSIAAFLQKIIPRSWLAIAANGLMVLRSDARRFAVDGLGNWINTQPEGTFVSPDVHTGHFCQIEATVGSYWFHEYTPKTGDVVIDVGAGIGEDAIILSRLVGPVGRVHAIEAHPGTFACLASTVERSRLTNVDTYQLAIAEQDGTASISDDSNHLANSIVAGGDGLAVESQSLDHFIERCAHPVIDLLKMNIEGAERGAMLGLNRQATKVRRLAISCHDFVAELGFGDQFRTKDVVRKRLLDLGFIVTERSDARTPWEADVLFASRS